MGRIVKINSSIKNIILSKVGVPTNPSLYGNRFGLCAHKPKTKAYEI